MAGDIVPVPAALFGPLLERVTDVTSLKCALRAIFVLHRKQASPERRGRLATVTAAELAADPVMGGADAAAVEGALATLAELGVLVALGGGVLSRHGGEPAAGGNGGGGLGRRCGRPFDGLRASGGGRGSRRALGRTCSGCTRRTSGSSRRWRRSD